MNLKSESPKEIEAHTADHMVKILINRARSNLASVKQWAEIDNYAQAGEYHAKAEALIEMLELLHIGSVGGVDKNQIFKSSLKDRLAWVEKKLKNRYPKLGKY